MEGYTNVVGSQYDFDDLDIEGRVVDEWSADEEKKALNKSKGTKQFDERSILCERVKLDNGQQADVFSVARKKENVWYTCHVCSDTVVGPSLFRQHVESNKHRNNMKNPVHSRTKFVKLDPKENLALEPGEPVPPGLEEVIIKTCLIQPKLDAYKASPLIGLEFLVELTQSTLDEGVYYYCLLCDKTGSERNMFIHLTSIFHYMKYLSVFFPTAARKLHLLPNKKIKKSFGLLVTEIVSDIEAKYGRMKPHSETHTDFHAPGRKSELQTSVYEGPHIKESENETFAEKATAENVEKKSKELQSVPPATSKIGETEKNEENKKEPAGGGSMFNKTSRVNMEKKQIRSREEDTHISSSPDVQIVNIQMPKSSPPVKKRRSRSKSLSSISTISSSSSRSRSRNRLRRHNSKVSSYGHSHMRSRHNWSRSRSRSPGAYRFLNRHSPSHNRRFSPGRRSRDRSPRKWNRGHRDSHGSPEPYKHRGIDRYGRSRDSKYDSRSDKYRRERHTEEKDSPKDVISAEERVRWAKFREDLEKIEAVKLEKLKYHEKNPEKHPQYPEEWKSFWNRRYNELQRSGVDPSKHDFKPEWISFWTKRMKDLYEEDLGKAKEELKKKFDLPEDPQYSRGIPWKHNQRKRNHTSPGLVDISPPTPDKKDVIADIKTTWKAFTGSDIKDGPKRPLSPWEEETKTRTSSPPMRRRQSSRSRSQSPITTNEKLLEDMPQRKSKTSSLIFVLRKLTVLEQQLGSLAPKVFEILSQSLALEKIKEDASLDLLFEEENCVFLETVREKLIALLCAGVVPRNIVNTARSAIKHIDIALYLASKRERSIPVGAVRTAIGGALPSQNIYTNQYMVQPKSEPVVVPGVGHVDKVAIAQQIATALIEQGKTDVTQAELEQLINAVVGMAEASINSAQPMTTANFLHQLQSMQNAAVSNTPRPMAPLTPSVPPKDTASIAAPQISAGVSNIQTVPSGATSQAAFGALKLLQSAYNDTLKPEQDSPKQDVEVVTPDSLPISDKEIALTLSKFNNTSKEEQPNFIQKLQTNNPEMYKRLHPFLPPTTQSTSDRSKRSPIVIPISKEKSEQKIKPLSSGRLSPFSSRSGGANPTEGEGVVEVEDDEKTEMPLKPKVNEGLTKHKFGSSDVDDDDDDDDDDYSFEDVYRAAQEKLRQKQLGEEKKTNQTTEKKGEVIEIIEKDSSEKEQTPQNNVESHQTSSTANTPWNLDKSDDFAASNSFKQQKQFKEDNFKTQYAAPSSYQQTYNSNNKPLGDGQQFHAQPEHYPSVDAPSISYQNRQQPTNSAMDDSSQPRLQNKDQYANEPVYPPTTEYYNENYSQDPAYSSVKDPYNYPREPDPTSYRDPYNVPYNTQANAGYSQHPSSYNEYYSYRDSGYRGDASGYSQARPPMQSSQPNFRPPHPPKYPNPNYPSY